MRPLPLIATAVLTLAAAPQAGGQGADVLLNCSACHTVGPARDSAAPAPYPNLNGQSARYLERQLRAYREGLRRAPMPTGRGNPGRWAGCWPTPPN